MKRKLFFVVIALGILILTPIVFSIQPSPLTAAPPAPISPTPTRLVPRSGTTIQPPITPPSPNNLPPEAEKTRAKQAIDGVLQKYLETLGPRYQVDSVEVVVRGEWAHGVANWKSQAKALNEPIHILARRLPNGTWVALMPNVDGLYPQWLDAIPESLVPATTKGTLRSQVSTTDVSRRSSTNLTLPTPAKSPVFLNKESSDTRVTPIPKSLELEKTPAQ